MNQGFSGGPTSADSVKPFKLSPLFLTLATSKPNILTWEKSKQTAVIEMLHECGIVKAVIWIFK